MAKITAELRLNLDALRRDTQRAVNIIQSELDRQFSAGGGGSNVGLATPAPVVGSGRPVTRGGKPWYTGPPPPVMPGGPGGGNPPVNWRLAGLSMLAGAFSPWIGGVGLAKSGIFGTGLGQQISNMFGGGISGNFLAAYTGLTVAVRTLKGVFNELGEAVKRTAKIYQESQSLNRSSSRLFQTSEAFKSIGMSEDAAKRFAVSGPGGLNAQEMMQFANMSQDFANSFHDAAVDARIIESSARQAQESFMASSRLAREWHTFWTGGAFQARLTEFKNTVADVLKAFNFLASLTGGKKDDSKPSAGMFNFGTLRESHLERMGFVVGGNPAIRYLSEIAYNTRIMVGAAGQRGLLNMPTHGNIP